MNGYQVPISRLKPICTMYLNIKNICILVFYINTPYFEIQSGKLFGNQFAACIARELFYCLNCTSTCSVTPLEVYVFVAVDETDEDDMSDEICHRCNGKRRRRRRGGRNVQLPDWVMDKIKRQHIVALAWVTKMNYFRRGNF